MFDAPPCCPSIHLNPLQGDRYRLCSAAATEAHAFRSYLAVSVPAALVVWSEWWAFEAVSGGCGGFEGAEEVDHATSRAQ